LSAAEGVLDWAESKHGRFHDPHAKSTI
jgi:hypothetical protein